MVNMYSRAGFAIRDICQRLISIPIEKPYTKKVWSKLLVKERESLVSEHHAMIYQVSVSFYTKVTFDVRSVSFSLKFKNIKTVGMLNSLVPILTYSDQ